MRTGMYKSMSIVKSSGPVLITAAATPQNLYLISAGGNVPRTAKIVKIMVGAVTLAGNAILRFGTGLGGAWAAILPPFLVVNAVDNEWAEDQIPSAVVAANITCQSSILGLTVMIEVEEFGG